MYRGKRSFWEYTFSLFANVSWKTLVLEAFILTFCECLVENARFGSLHSHFFCECLVESARFGSLHSHFLRMFCGKRSFWKSTFSLFECPVLVLEAFGVSFCECLVENALFGSLHSHFLRMSRGKPSFWKPSLSLFANVWWKPLVFVETVHTTL